jgi:hypothetical protein
VGFSTIPVCRAGHWSAVHGPELIEQYVNLLKANPATESRAKDTRR